MEEENEVPAEGVKYIEEIEEIEPIAFNESMSPTIGSLAGALASAQGQMSNGAKGKQGFNYKYLELGGVVDIARKPLSDNELAVIQSHQLIKGKRPSVVTHTTIIHSSGEWHKSSIELPIHVMKQLSQAQMIGVNCTYGRRYALQSICLIAAEDDTDATSK